MEIQICPPNGTVSFGTEYLTDKVDLSAVESTIDMIYWYTDTQTGRIFYSEAAAVDGFAKLPTDIDSISSYQYILDSANNMRYAEENPVIYYHKFEGKSVFAYGQDEYTYVGQEELFVDYPQPTSPPEGLTDKVPPVRIFDRSDSKLQWDGSNWQYTVIPLTESLENAKIILKNELLGQIKILVENQLRIHSAVDIFAATSIGDLEPADKFIHGMTTIRNYNNALKSSISSRLATIETATELSQLIELESKVNDLLS